MTSSLLAILLLWMQASPQTASVEGFVVRTGTGEPVPRAQVSLSPLVGVAGSLVLSTDAGGKFVFPNIQPGQYRIYVTRDGYVRAEYGQRAPGRPGLPINVAPGQQLKDVIVQALPTGAIAGHIYDRFGQPLGNATVQALKYIYQDGARMLIAAQSGKTNDLGEYRLYWLQPGSYIISASAPDAAGPSTTTITAVRNRIEEELSRIDSLISQPEPGRNQKGNEVYVPVYFPGTTDAASAAPIDLLPGAYFTGVDLTVSDTRAVNVRGVVTGFSQTIGPAVTMQPRGAAAGGTARRGAGGGPGGSFEFRGVAPGTYDLVVSLSIPGESQPGVRRPTTRMMAHAVVEVGSADVENIVLNLHPGFNISGRLTIDGRPANQSAAEMVKFRVQLREPNVTQTAPAFAGVAADGTFTVTGAIPGDYRLTILAPGFYTKSARMGSDDVLNGGLRLAGEPPGPLEVVLGSSSATLDAAVLDERRQSWGGVTVVLVPNPPYRHRVDLYRTSTTDASGHARFDNVAPGDYRVFAWDDVEPGAWQDPDFLVRFENAGKIVRIGESGREVVELISIPSAR